MISRASGFGINRSAQGLCRGNRLHRRPGQCSRHPAQPNRSASGAPDLRESLGFNFLKELNPTGNFRQQGSASSPPLNTNPSGLAHVSCFRNTHFPPSFALDNSSKRGHLLHFQ